MGSVGDCYDNALCESFFATLECELLDRRPFRSQEEARRAVFEFTPSRCSFGIEGWHNPHRRHSSLNYASPARYEMVRAHATLDSPKPPTVHQNGATSHNDAESEGSPLPTPSQVAPLAQRVLSTSRLPNANSVAGRTSQD